MESAAADQTPQRVHVLKPDPEKPIDVVRDVVRRRAQVIAVQGTARLYGEPLPLGIIKDGLHVIGLGE